MTTLKKIYQSVWYALIFTIPLEVVQFSVYGFQIRLHQAMFALFCIIAAVYFRKSLVSKLTEIFRSLRLPEFYYQHIYLALFLIIWFISTIGGMINSSDIITTIVRSGVLFGYIGVFAAVYYGLRTRNQVTLLLRTLIASTLVLLIIGLYEAIAKQIGWPTFTVFDGRVDSLLPEPNWFGMWITIMIAIVLPLWYHVKTTRAYAGYSVLLIALIFMNILTLTRAAWLTTFVVFLIFVSRYLLDKTQRIKMLKSIPSLLAIVAMGIVISQVSGLSGFNLRDRVQSIFTQDTIIYSEIESDGEVIINKEVVEDVNATGRIQNYQDALRISSDHLLLGVGQGGFEERIGPGFNTSNIFLSVLVSSGIIGVSIFVGIIYLMVKQSIYFFSDHLEYSSISLGIVTTISLVGMFNDAFLMGFIWAVLALSGRLPDLIIDEDIDRVG